MEGNLFHTDKVLTIREGSGESETDAVRVCSMQFCWKTCNSRNVNNYSLVEGKEMVLPPSVLAGT